MKEVQHQECNMTRYFGFGFIQWEECKLSFQIQIESFRILVSVKISRKSIDMDLERLKDRGKAIGLTHHNLGQTGPERSERLKN